MTPQKTAFRVVDGDGHVVEDPAGIARHLPKRYRDEFEAGRLSRMFPPMDHFHELPMVTRGQNERAEAGTVVGPQEWRDFLSTVGIERSVLYPSLALSYGKVRDRDWSIAVCRAYNDWLAEAYLDIDKVFAGMALIPLQEPDAAVEELRRAVTDLGMRGAMLPSHGQALHLGSKEFWPIYEEAEALGCAIAVHGGCHDGLGFDDMNVYAAVHALGHPFGQLISLGGMLFNGVFQRFPGLRVGYLEGGSAWLFLAIERFEESYESHIPYNDRRELLDLGESTDVSDYLIELLRTGRIYVGCEGGEHNLADIIRTIGRSPFFYSSDFPHEVTEESCRHELDKLGSLDVSEDDRQLTLAGNSEAFYRL
jgi:uncharacterized protein